VVVDISGYYSSREGRVRPLPRAGTGANLRHPCGRGHARHGPNQCDAKSIGPGGALTIQVAGIAGSQVTPRRSSSTSPQWRRAERPISRSTPTNPIFRIGPQSRDRRGPGQPDIGHPQCQRLDRCLQQHRKRQRRRRRVGLVQLTSARSRHQRFRAPTNATPLVATLIRCACRDPAASVVGSRRQPDAPVRWALRCGRVLGDARQEVGPVVRTGDAECLTQLGRALHRSTSRRARASPAHRVDSRRGFERADQHGASFAVEAADDVGTPVHAVSEIDVQKAGGPNITSVRG